MPVASTLALSVQVSDFEDNCLLIQCNRLYALPVRRASALPAASFGFHLTMDTLAVRLTLPPVGRVKDFEKIFSSPSSRCALPGAQLKGRKPHEVSGLFLCMSQNLPTDSEQLISILWDHQSFRVRPNFQQVNALIRMNR